MLARIRSAFGKLIEQWQHDLGHALTKVDCLLIDAESARLSKWRFNVEKVHFEHSTVLVLVTRDFIIIISRFV